MDRGGLSQPQLQETVCSLLYRSRTSGKKCFLDFDTFPKKQPIGRLQDPDFRYAVEVLVSNVLKIMLSGRNVKNRVLWLDDHNSAFRFQMERVWRGPGERYSQSIFLLGRVSMVALAWPYHDLVSSRAHMGSNRAIRRHRGELQIPAQQILQEEWENIDQQVITTMTESMPHRLQAVIAARGGNTKS
ncbi:hypothetical protein J6590_030942 [Homalodisca vitripennis]|nr:hypothetical protein J6590_030942 [Homalodisca vitripennis]